MSEEALTMQFVKRIDLPYKGMQMRLGDINGDGRLEIVMLQPDRVEDDAFYPHEVIYAAAYSADGELLWEIGTPDTEARAVATDIPAQIYDIDNDGVNELLCVMGGEFCIFDGAGGTLKRKFALPDKNAHDCIAIADLEGSGYARNIILKNRYHQLWAMDLNFNLMWSFKGNIGHFLLLYDINGDGRDEVIAGYNVLSGDGDLLWSCDMPAHADRLWVGSFDMNGEMLPSVVIGGGELATFNAVGEKLWSFDSTLRSAVFGNFCDDRPGCETAGIRRGEENDWLVLADRNGNMIYELPLGVRGCTVRCIEGFCGRSRDAIMVCGSGVTAEIFNGALNLIASVPANGSIEYADLAGDGSVQLLTYNDEKIEIFSRTAGGLAPIAMPEVRPQDKRLRNMTRFDVGAQNLCNYAVRIAAGSCGVQSAAEWASTVLADDAAYDAPMLRGRFAVMFTDALGLSAFERENFSDVYDTDYFCEATGTLKKLGIVEGTFGRFGPRQHMTGAEARDMIKHAGRSVELVPDGELSERDAARIIAELAKKQMHSGL